MRPWVISNTLNFLSSNEAGMNAEYGLDIYFANAAADRQKAFYGFETVTEQLSLLNAVSLESQAYSLSQVIREFTGLSDYLLEILQIWKRGDVGSMESIVMEGFDDSGEAREYYQSLFADRNRNWVKSLLDLVENQPKSRIFIVVGSGHLVGPDSLIRMLIQEGFDVKRY